MAEWNRSRDLCNKCNSQLYRVTDSTGQLIAKHCKWCGERLPTPEEQERMNRHQKEVQDGEVGQKAREEAQIRQLQRLEFNDQFSPYKNKTNKAKWVKSGYRKKLKVKRLFILAGVCFIITTLILLITGV